MLPVGIDGSAMKNFKSTEAYRYVHSEKVGCVVHCESEKEDYVFLKASVNPSQASTPSHSAWVLTRTDGAMETTGCTWVA